MLILALWSLGILTAFATSLGYLVRQKATLLDRIEHRAQLWNAAWAGVEAARSAVKSDTDTEVDSRADGWANPKMFKDVQFPDALMNVGFERVINKKKIRFWGVADEQGKLNLNKAEAPVLAALLRQITGLDSDGANAVAFAVVDWRDSDSSFGHPDFGAEDSDYGGLPKPYDAKDLPFETLDELLLVKGVNRDIFEKMKPYVTVFGSGAVNINTTDQEVLSALGLPQTAAEKVIRHRDGGDGEPGSSDDRIFISADTIVSDMNLDEPPLNEIERAAIESLIEAGTLVVNTGFFGVTSRAESSDGRAYQVVEAVLNRDGDILYSRSTGTRWNDRQAAAAQGPSRALTA